MTLIELQDVLGNCINNIVNETDKNKRIEEINKGTAVCSLAKQMINNADVILRADKLIIENKTTDTHITSLMGD